MEPFEPRLILVPTDFSEPAAHALRYASALSERFGAHLLVIHADRFVPVMDFTAIPAGVFSDLQESMIENAREVLQAHAEENISAAVPFDLRVIVGDTLDTIAAQIRESGANLVVMGTHGRTGVSRLLFGSVTESVMRMSTVPVIAVNPGASERAVIRKVLCPITFTETSRAALQYAAALADTPTAPLVLAQAIDDDDAHIGMRDRIRIQNWIPRELAGRCEMRLATAEAAEDVVRMARESGADLIALGIETASTVYETLRGTLAERIVQQSGCAVLTMNEHAASRLSPAAEPAPAGHQAGSLR
jgi:nucleotide-binding universal stress UspA family protein